MVAGRRSPHLLVSTFSLVPLVAASCGGGGGGEGVKGNAAAITATFPAAHCVTDGRKLTFRGTTADPKNIQSLEIGGVPVSTNDDFATWSARVAIGDASTRLRVVARDRSGAELPPVDLTVDFETVPSSPVTLALDPKRQQVLVGEDRLEPFGAVALDLASGHWIEVSGPTRGTGTEVSHYRAFAVDAAEDLAYGLALSPVRVLRIDLATGKRAILSDTSSAGEAFGVPLQIDLDPSHQRLLLVDISKEALITVDLVDGARAIFSDASHGSGPAFDSPEGLHVIEAQGRVLVADGNLHALLSVDLETGDRSIVSDANRGAGPDFELPRGVAFDPASGDALVLDIVLGALLRVDLLTGDRTVVMDRTSGGAKFESLASLAGRLDPSGRALVVDQGAARILAVDLASGVRKDLGRVHVGEATPLGSVFSFAVDPSTGHLFVTKRSPVAALLEVDPVTGRRSLVSSDDRGGGSMFIFGRALAISTTRRQALVADPNTLFAIDLATGNRSLLVDSAFDSITALEMDEESDAVLVLDDAGDDTALVSVDLATGERTEVSGPSWGSGESFFCPEALALDPDGLTAYVVSSCQAALFRVDRVSGDREVVSSAAIGGGPPIEHLKSGLSLDPDGRHAYVTDFDLGIVKVDLVTGDRVVVSGPDVGSGPPIADRGVLDPARGRFFARPANAVSILSIDLESGDRVMISY